MAIHLEVHGTATEASETLPQHRGKKEMNPKGYSPTSTYAQWHVCTSAHTHPKISLKT